MPSQLDELLKGRYRVQAKLAEGGMGAVYRAFDVLEDRPCALKELRLVHLPTEEQTRLHEDEDATQVHGRRNVPRPTREKAIEQFQTEAQLLARLDHPNLPKVFDFFIEGSECYLAMDLIEGKDLARVLALSSGAATYRDLLRMLNDPHPNVVCQVYYALGRRGQKSAIPLIINNIKQSAHWYTQWYGYGALRKLGWRQSRSK